MFFALETLDTFFLVTLLGVAKALCFQGCFTGTLAEALPKFTELE